MNVLNPNTTETVLIRDAYTCQLRLQGCDRYATVTVLKDPTPRTTFRPASVGELMAACVDCANQPR